MLSEIISHINSKISELNYFTLYELAELVEKNDVTSPMIYNINGAYVDPITNIGQGVLYHREISQMTQSQSVVVANKKSFKDRSYSLRCFAIFQRNFVGTDSKYTVDEICQSVIQKILSSRKIPGFKYSNIDISGREIRRGEAFSAEFLNTLEIDDTYAAFYIDYSVIVTFDEDCYIQVDNTVYLTNEDDDYFINERRNYLTK